MQSKVYSLFIGNNSSMFFQSPPPPPNKPLTVWIHGTRGSAFLPVGISPKIKQVHDEFCLPPLGLNRVCDIPTCYHQHSIARILCQADSLQFAFDAFYVYGWSGDLDPLERVRAALTLYDQLQKLIQDYKNQYHTEPHITIITHSHGGNVALNLVLGHQSHSHKITINRLILLACPVQQETEDYCNHELFKQAYSLYSYADLIQCLDPQKFHPLWQVCKSFTIESIKKVFRRTHERPLFSKRHFNYNFNVYQAAVAWKNIIPWDETDIASFSHFQKYIRFLSSKKKKMRGLSHLEFLLPSFLRHLPYIITTIDNYSQHSAVKEYTIDL